MKKLGISLLVSLAMGLPLKAQTLEKMQWFNEPEQWEVKNKALTMQVTPQSDYCIQHDRVFIYPPSTNKACPPWLVHDSC